MMVYTVCIPGTIHITDVDSDIVYGNVKEDPIKSKLMALANVPSHNIRRWNYESKAKTSAEPARNDMANFDMALETTLFVAKNEAGCCLPANANSYRKIDAKAAAADCCATCFNPSQAIFRKHNFMSHLLSYELGIFFVFRNISLFSKPVNQPLTSPFFSPIRGNHGGKFLLLLQASPPI